jgi:hypothetical protein
MEFAHHGLQIVLDDDWWVEAGMAGFASSSAAYPADPDAFPGQRIFEVRIDDIGPVRRASGVGIFNDDRETGSSAHDRVVKILRGFRSGALIPPVQVVKTKPGDDYPYKLVAGTHRLYCSLAAGFSHVPATFGFDITNPDG